MKRQIFRSICFATAIVFLASLIFTMGVLYDYFSTEQRNELKAETSIVASAVELNGKDYLSSITEEDLRVTWIASDGTVLYDNKAETSEMENHLEREEIQEALQTGEGESSRYSTTLMEQQIYCAIKLEDGSVLRMSSDRLTWWALILSMLQPILIIIGVALALSVFLAYRLSKRIIKPLNELNLESPESTKTYEELTPLMTRIKAQQNQLRMQEKELKKKKEEFDAATEHMREGIILLGEKGNVLSINHAASRVLKISRYSIGKDLLIFNNTLEIQELLRIAGSGKQAEKLITIDGKDYQFNASPMISEEKIAGYALIIFDITEKEKAEKSRREFTANVSHELKTPLQNISGCAELLANGLVKPEDVKDFSGKIYAESRRMITLIDDIIKLSHLDENSTQYEFEQLDLFELAKLTHRNLLSLATEKNIDFTISGESAMINGIPSLISEIMYNLCDNAIKYNVPGGSVEMNVSSSENGAVLSVSDTGIGIPPEEQDRIFERFYRVDKSHSKEVGGTGLGLSIVKHAAAVNGASIEVTSKIGIGTVFTIKFSRIPEAGNDSKNLEKAVTN